MVGFINNCCNCATPSYPCQQELCPNRHVKIYICDKCKSTVDFGELFYFDGDELCIDCIQSKLELVR